MSFSITEIFTAIDHFIWGPPLLILLAGTGIYFTYQLRFIQINQFTRGWCYLFQKEPNAKGDVSPFAALCTALAATIGTGNIVGVATAVHTGGPGAIFWMWIVAFFGMATKYAECLLALKYRSRERTGLIAGGPMYYIEKGLGNKPLAKLFALFGIGVALFGIGTFPQMNAITQSLNHSFHIPVNFSAFAVTALVAMIILGGVKRIAKVASVIVPFMALLYVLTAGVILVMNAEKLPVTFSLIFHAAFNPEAALGGVIGYSVLQAIQSGMARGIFSNEAGLGSAPIAAAAAQTQEPVRQGLISMMGTFLDTLVVCTITGVMLVLTGAWQGELEGAAATHFAFQQGLGSAWGADVVTIGLLFFAFTTILGWCYYGERCWVYLLGIKGIKTYRFIFLTCVLSGAFLTLDLIWIIADIVNGLMAVPNLIALIGLRNVVIEETKNFFNNL